MTNPDPFQMGNHVEMPAPEALQDRTPGPDHRAGGDRKPNAFWRTLLQVGPAAALSLLVILPEILEEIVTSFGDTLPPNLYGALVAITAGVTLIAGILAKVMAMPAVQSWLGKYLPIFAATKPAKK